jgi:hypothetical protein
MPFRKYDPKTMKLLDAVFDKAWAELTVKREATVSISDAAKMKMAVTNRLLAAADRGERDPDRLRRIALDENHGIG